LLLKEPDKSKKQL